jgi:dTDP-glucose 4,6-dehydratase
VPFVKNNVDVILSTLELARQVKPKAFILVSTDEVYGPVESWDYEGHEEWATILPSNPYAASKAAQEAIAISYWRTYGVPLQIVNCMNMIGERQDPEKFIPLVIGKVLRGETVTIHGTPGHLGTRHYLHARNLADGITFLLKNTVPVVFPAHWEQQLLDTGQAGINSDRPDRYNIATPDRIDNLAMADLIAAYAGKSLKYELVDFHSTRPGHDPHYGLDPALMESLGWTPPVPLETSLKKTVEWTLQHPEWLLAD